MYIEGIPGIMGGLLQLIAYGAQDVFLHSNELLQAKLFDTREDLLYEFKHYFGDMNETPEGWRYGSTFLYEAVDHSWTDVVQYFLEQGANPNRGNSCLQRALHLKDLDIVNILIKHGARIHDVFYYTWQSDFNVLQYLVEHGAHINIRNKNGDTIRDIFNSHFVQCYIINTKDYSDEDMDEDEDDDIGSDSDSEYAYYDDTERRRDYMRIDVNSSHKEPFQYISKKLAGRRWVFVKCYVKWLGIHQRAVISANHPNRLKELGVFDCEDE